ncbi:hypothetical protein CASFOL_006071 [Castilleja foliolosa]|uniref:DNA topoisomerase n=1 Tax=Castilleja foliolosa TaxID=1961234 RepID=A0ABD3E5N5_9LAMI
MDLQIKHAVVVKVIGMTWSRSQVTQGLLIECSFCNIVWLRNRAFRSYSRVCLKYSSTNAEKSQHFPRRIKIPCTLGIKAEIKNNPLMSHVYAPYSFSPFRVRSPFGCELSSSGIPVSVPWYGLLSGVRSPYHCSSSRSFSQIPRAGTRNNVVMTEGGGERNDISKTHNNKHRKGPKVFGTRKGNATSAADELASSSTEVKAGEIALGNNAKGKEKVKQLSKGKKPQKNQSSSASAASVDAGQISEAKEIKNNNKTSKQSPVSTKRNNSPSSPPVAVVDTTKNVPRKATRSSTKKGKSNTKTVSLLKPNEEPTGQSNDKVASPGQISYPNIKTKPGGQKGWPQLYPPIAKSVVVVESATKAKVIQGYLGDMYEVLPSYGHVRDLAARSGSVRPDDDFSMVWEVPSPAWSHLKSIKVALSGAENLILASDPDREGEAIAWHIFEMLQQQDALREDVSVARVVFNEITESSIKSALQSPREIDADLVHAYLARRALDYLIGFNVSPLLWRKLPGCQSAGRVQSAALALICDREKEIDEFKPQEYWSVDTKFQTKDKNSVKGIHLSSHLTHFDSKKLNQLSISSNVEAKDAEEKINQFNFVVIGSKTSKSRRNPPTPYITSTLQQDAANKLNFTASHTMKVAQKLYEGFQLSDGKSTGLITYMRTDGLHLSDEAAKDIQSLVAEKYGPSFAAKTTRKYFKKVKNAQEAHEAIRPTDIRRQPSMLAGVLDADCLKLYILIWSRTMACQMEPAVIEQIQCDIANANQSIVFRSTCSRVEFLGFQAVYEDIEAIKAQNNEEHHRSEVFGILSNLKSGEPLILTEVELDQHHTQPPPRYSEGSLVKKLEELGIGRPSTYATTIKVLKDRNYITMKNRALCPEFRGRMVSAFLSHYFSEVTDYSFTADMETELDNVSAGMTEWKGLLKDYWTRFSKYCECAGNVHIHQVEKMLEKTFGYFLFSALPDGNKTCPSCMQGTLVFKVSRFGAGYFIGCDQHPKCKYIATTLYGEDDEDNTPEHQKNNMQEPKLLGQHPGSSEKVFLKNGPYGYYVQLGDDRKGHLPKRASASRIKDINSITLEDALDLLQYPVTLGKHPDDGQPVELKLAKVGFSIRHRRTIGPVPKNMKPEDITLEKALELLQGKDVKRSGRPKRNKVVEEAIKAK